MRFMSTQVHGIIDYVVGVLLIVAPWLFTFARGGAETWIPVILGVGTILYSLLTDYELGVIRVIPMPVHLGIDASVGIFLAVSPWLLAYADFVWIPHVAVGLVQLAASLTTQRSPYRRWAARY